MTVTIVRAHDADERAAAFALRRAVFVDEQGVPLAAEFDEHEATAVHLLARDGQAVVGTLRWRRYAPGVGKIERVAVVREQRGRGIGVALIKHALAELWALGLCQAVLHAQVQAQAFYDRLGFRAEGDVFDEDGIPHIRMRRLLTAP